MRILRTAAVLACALGFAATPGHAQEIKIGAVFPMSGPNAEIGEIFSRSATIASGDEACRIHLGGHTLLPKPVPTRAKRTSADRKVSA